MTEGGRDARFLGVDGERWEGWEEVENLTAQEETPHPGGPPGEALSGPVRAGQRVPTKTLYPDHSRISMPHDMISEFFSKNSANCWSHTASFFFITHYNMRLSTDNIWEPVQPQG